jgi:hypothetical protein
MRCRRTAARSSDRVGCGPYAYCCSLPRYAKALARSRDLFRFCCCLSCVVDDDFADKRSELGARCGPDGYRDGRCDRVVVNNVRNFTWRSNVDFDQRWEQRTYYLSHLTDVDLIMSYWMGEAIAHTIVSFGF